MVALVTAYAGIRKALKDLKTGEVSGVPQEKVVSATLVETHTMLMWSESNRSLVEKVGELVDKLESATHALNYNTETGRSVSREIGELRHQIERLRDKMP